MSAPAMMVSGFGKYHTSNPKARNPKPLAAIDLDGIRVLADNPQSVVKDAAQWFIPSTLLSREHGDQEANGEYWTLWADFDHDPQPLVKIHEGMRRLIVGGCDFELCNSNSATTECPKARLIVPLGKPLCGADWKLAQEVFNDQLQAAGFNPDRVTERAAQLCYLPNRGALYETLSARSGVLFNHATVWGGAMAIKLDALVQEAAAVQARKATAQAKREAMQANAPKGVGKPDLIAAFNDAFTVEEILLRSGYDQRGDKFRHPGSESGSYSASVKDGRVHSLSSGDALYTGGIGGGAHDAFSAFAILSHGGNRDAALKDAADNWLCVNGESWNRFYQREYAQAKASEAALGDWPDLADPFAKYAVPAFPVDALPEPFALLCRELSAQSGFDVGGYAFSCLVIASSLAVHRKKMRAGPLSVPAFLWGGLVASSGGGKSPTLNTVARAVRELNDGLVRESQRQLEQWFEQQRNAETAEDRKNVGPKPLWEQLTASDTTVEALGQLMADNPQGMLLLVDELTGFIGRMDAYNAPGSGKDRAVYLSAWDGGGVTINRASKAPLVVENFSVGIMCGIQPEKLGELFKKSGGGSDGLYQRFLMYAMQPAGNVDYAAELGIFTDVNASNLFNTLHQWTREGSMGSATLCAEALPLMQAYHQSMRTIAQRTAAKRLAEHLDKYPGFLARVAYALHCMECAVQGEYLAIVGVDTFNRAKRIMQVMYHHSVAVYEVLDTQSGDLARLTRAACEAILSQGWKEIKRGDLTRYATDWRDADDRQAESALDYLIELGWVKDITPAVEPGKRGRRSNGVFLVNKLVHQTFTNHTERIKTERAARYLALQTIVGARHAAETAY